MLLWSKNSQETSFYCKEGFIFEGWAPILSKNKNGFYFDWKAYGMYWNLASVSKSILSLKGDSGLGPI